MTNDETIIYDGTPSQWSNFWYFALCIFIIPIFVAIYQYFKLKCTVNTITTQKIVTERGMFSKDINELLLKRVIDVKMHQSFGQRLVGLSDIIVYSTDSTSRMLEIKGVRNGRKIWDELRDAVSECRKGIREIEEREV